MYTFFPSDKFVCEYVNLFYALCTWNGFILSSNKNNVQGLQCSVHYPDNSTNLGILASHQLISAAKLVMEAIWLT